MKHDAASKVAYVILLMTFVASVGCGSGKRALAHAHILSVDSVETQLYFASANSCDLHSTKK